MHIYNELCDTWNSQDVIHIHDVKMTGSSADHDVATQHPPKFIIADATYQWEKQQTETI